MPPCRRCGSTVARQGPGAGPHYARLVCDGCGRFLRWLPKPAEQGTSFPFLLVAEKGSNNMSD
jgi:hypothetical protein